MTGTDAGIVRQGVYGAIRSYDHRGCVFSWQPPAGAFRRVAIDVEAKDSPVDAMSRRFGLSPCEFRLRWTTLEAEAKVLDEPVHLLLKRLGLRDAACAGWTRSAAGVWLCLIEHPTHWITVAVVQASGVRSLLH